MLLEIYLEWTVARLNNAYNWSSTPKVHWIQLIVTINIIIFIISRISWDHKQEFQKCQHHTVKNYPSVIQLSNLFGLCHDESVYGGLLVTLQQNTLEEIFIYRQFMKIRVDWNWIRKYTSKILELPIVQPLDCCLLLEIYTGPWNILKHCSAFTFMKIQIN